jgi:nicotinate-nucleotide adenylyltransferase
VKKIGLFFGSFNPVHTGHMVIAQHIQQHFPLDEVWLVVSPQNPFKEKKNLLPERTRWNMVDLAIGEAIGLRASDVEFALQRPSYTVATLAHLKEKHPEHLFHLIMGSDNRKNLHKWRNGDYIETHFPIIVYPRGTDVAQPMTNTHWVDAPRMEISSSHIRQELKAGKEVRYLLPEKVWEFLTESDLYR